MALFTVPLLDEKQDVLQIWTKEVNIVSSPEVGYQV